VEIFATLGYTGDKLLPVQLTRFLSLVWDFQRFHDTGNLFFASNNDTGDNLSPVSTTPTMKQLQQYQVAEISEGTSLYDHYMSAYSNPAASKLKMKNFQSQLYSRLLWLTFAVKYLSNFRKNSKRSELDTQGRKLIH
jgi:hypothetical protein